MINPESRVSYANRFLARLLAWTKIFGITCQITTRYPDGSVVLVLEDFVKTRNKVIEPTMDASLRKKWRIKVSDELNIKLVRVYGKGVKIYVYYMGKMVGSRMIKPEEYIDISRFFGAEDEVLNMYGLVLKTKTK
jgi:hypothetical protein